MNATIKKRIEDINNGQVLEGYEKTSFGIFPCDWEKDKSLGDICEINPKTEALPNEFIYIDLESVVDGKLIQENVIEKAKAPSRAQRVLRKNDVIYQMVRPYQKNNFIFIQDDGNYKYVASTGYAQLRSDNYGFLYQMVNSEYFCTQVLKKCTGTNYPAINSQDLADVNCAYPKTEQEQSRIAQILMQWDKTIELQEKYIASLENRKKALMQRLLTPKEGWKKVELGEICDIRTGNKNTQDKVDNGKYPFYVRSATVERINTYSFDGEAILIPGDGNIGDICHYINAKFDYHQRVYKVSSNDKTVSVKYLYYFLQKNLKKRVIALSAKATVDSIRLDMLTEMEIYIPDIYEKISNTLSQADQEISLQKEKLQNLIAQRKALMQVLLTGIVRV